MPHQDAPSQASLERFGTQAGTLKEKTKPSIEQFGRNFIDDVTDLAKGFGTLLMLPFAKSYQFLSDREFRQNELEDLKNFYQDPTGSFMKQVYKPVIEPILKDFSEWKNPARRIYERPLSAFLDVATLVSLGAGAAGEIAPVARATQLLSKAQEATTLAGIGRGAEKIARTIGLGEIIDYNKLALDPLRRISKTDATIVFKRSLLLKPMADDLKKVSEEEFKQLVPHLEGLVEPLNPSLAYRNLYNKVADVITEQEILKLGNKTLKPAVAEARKFQPLMKSSGLDIETIKRLAPDIDPLYISHYFGDLPDLVSKAPYFLKKPLRSIKPKYMKPSKGVPGYVGFKETTKNEWWEAFSRQVASTIEFSERLKLIEEIKAQPYMKELGTVTKNMPFHKLVRDKLTPGYRIVPFDDYLNFYRGSIDLAKKLETTLKKTKDVPEAVEEAIKLAFPNPEEAIIKYLGVTRIGKKFWQAPQAVADVINDIYKPVSPFFGLLVDKPLDLFRVLALANPRFLYNNFFNHIAFQALADNYNVVSRYGLWREAMRKNLIPAEFFHGSIPEAERVMIANVGRVGDKPLGGILHNISKSWVGQMMRKFTDLIFGINRGMDDLSRGVLFTKEVTSAAKINILKHGKRIKSQAELFQYGLKDPDIVEAALKRTGEGVYSMTPLLPFERKIFRRIFPFYSWLRWSTGYALRLTFNEPLKTNVLKRITTITNSITGQDKLPTWAQGAIPIKANDDGTITYFKSSGPNPLNTINQLIERGFLRGLLLSASPPIKTIYESIAKEEAFTGRKFDSKDVIKDIVTGQYYRFDPEKETFEQTQAPSPTIVELALRNYIPYYVAVEDALVGKERYTAAGLPTLLQDMFRKEKVSVKELPEEFRSKDFSRLLGFLGFPLGRTRQRKELDIKTLQRLATQAQKRENIPVTERRREIKIKTRAKILKSLKEL